MEPPWHHDLMLSIHSYYVGEYAAGIRSSERILNSDSPEDIKLNVSKNLSFYIKPISEDFKVSYTDLKTDSVKPGWSLFNPTIISIDNKLIALVRSSNYKIDSSGNYSYPEEDNFVIKNCYYRFELDSNLITKEVAKVTLPDYEKTNYPVEGLEDLRIFRGGEDCFVSGTIRNKAPHNGNCKIAVARYDLIQNKIEDPDVIITDIEHEKNWMPVSNATHPKWIHHSNLDNRTSIINYIDSSNCNLQFNNCKFAAAKSFRGGSQLIEFSEKYYSIVHEVTLDSNKRRIYYHRFCEWDSELNLLRYSKAFYLKNNRTIEFAAGLAIKDEMVHITFGLEDKEAWIASFTTENMLSLFFLEGKPI